MLEKFFIKKNIMYYDILLTYIPMGERSLINDNKPSGLKTAYAINAERDRGFNVQYTINNEL